MSKAQTISTTASDPTVAAAAAQFLSPVVLGLRNETHVEVKRGLEPGAALLLAAPEGPVRRREPPPPAA